jgi:hypothetical protein
MAGLAPAAAIGSLAAATPAIAAAQPQALTRSAFLACVGDTFTFDKTPLDQVSAKLARVHSFGEQDTPKAEGRFVLQFEASNALPEQTYRVHHPRFGSFAIFVSASDARQLRVEATFNQL